MRNTTFNLPEDLIARAKAYAARNGTSMTAIIRDHLEAVTASRSAEGVPDVLTGFARGLVSREDALSALGLRDYAELLVALGDHDLVPPRPPEHEIENQAVAFERLWRSV